MLRRELLGDLRIHLSDPQHDPRRFVIQVLSIGETNEFRRAAADIDQGHPSLRESGVCTDREAQRAESLRQDCHGRRLERFPEDVADLLLGSLRAEDMQGNTGHDAGAWRNEVGAGIVQQRFVARRHPPAVIFLAKAKPSGHCRLAHNVLRALKLYGLLWIGQA
jgi:hypothetical protein